jgi:hypothetical protein
VMMWKGKLWCYEHCEGRFSSLTNSLVYPHEKKALITFHFQSERSH